VAARLRLPATMPDIKKLEDAAAEQQHINKSV